MFAKRMLKDIPIIGCQLVLMLALASLLIGLVVVVVDGASFNDEGRISVSQKSPIFHSEYKLRSIVENINDELRQLKRDFTEHTTQIYLNLKTDNALGFVAAEKKSAAAVAALLMNEQFADIIIRRHIIQRRLLTGLKSAFVRFLPIRTLQRLVENFDSYSWLKEQSQVDLRPRFPGAVENQYVQLYALIDLRARLRAADDILTLTTDNMRRVMNTLHYFLVDRKHPKSVQSSDLNALASYGSIMLNYYNDNVIQFRQNLEDKYERLLTTSSRLAALIGGPNELRNFIDRTIDSEALDVDLNQEAESLDLPPTISNEIVNNLQRSWIPKVVLENIQADRGLLLRNKAAITLLIDMSEEKKEEDLASWIGNLSHFICRATPFGGNI